MKKTYKFWAIIYCDKSHSDITFCSEIAEIYDRKINAEKELRNSNNKKLKIVPCIVSFNIR